MRKQKVISRQELDLAVIEPKLHTGPKAAKRFENVLKAAMTVPKADYDKSVAAEKRRKVRRKKAA